MTTPQESLLEFPCEFPIKAFGRSDTGFEERVVRIIARHVPEISTHMVKSRPSRGGKYVSVTVLIMANSRSQLDLIYHDLTRCEEVLIAL